MKKTTKIINGMGEKELKFVMNGLMTQNYLRNGLCKMDTLMN